MAAPEVVATAKGSDIWFASLFTTDPELSLVESSPGRYHIGGEVIDFEADGNFEINGRPCGTQGENF
ncbi:MAG TPA: hypothetical protein DD435_15545 [Cyanobacteria bacterium UBA8530]|nr:hypothetical protein [Cyanobacteria bacterium UBA8530]